MRCGKCHGNHESVAQVRACYNVEAVPTGLLRKNRYPGDCYRCGAFLEAEQGHIELVEGGWKVFHNGACPVQFKAASANGWQDYGSMAGSYTEAIKPVAPVQVTRASSSCPVPEGHYAVPSLSGKQDLDFFQVNRPKEGKWAGYVFVKRVIGGRPSVPVRKAEKARALAAIAAAGIEAAAVKYGQEIGRCYRCNRHLTDETSRRLGIGPDCRSRVA